jgi:hypothetical protein
VHENRLKRQIALEKSNQATLRAINKSWEEFSHSLCQKRSWRHVAFIDLLVGIFDDSLNFDDLTGRSH